MRLRMLLLPALLIGAGCNDSTLPARALQGRWGGENAYFKAQGRQVAFGLACWGTQFNGLVVPDAAGDFALPQAATQPISATIRGHVSGDAMTLVVTTTAQQESYQLVRGTPAIVTMFCAAQ